MYYVLLDSSGNLIASYRDEAEAQAALEACADDEIALMTYDDEGNLAADPVFAVLTHGALTAHADSRQWWGTPGENDWQNHPQTVAEPVG